MDRSNQNLFEQSREAWKDIRSNSVMLWQVLALALAVLGLTANVLVTGTPPIFLTQFGWFLLLFAASFVAICAYVLLWLKLRMFTSIAFIIDAENELEKANELKIFITRRRTIGDSINPKRLNEPLLSFYSIGSPITVLIWFLFFLEIGISIIWLFQAQSPIIIDTFMNFSIILVIIPFLFLFGSYALIASNENIKEKFSEGTPDSIRKNIYKRLMAYWAILHPTSFAKFWDDGIKDTNNPR